MRAIIQLVQTCASAFLQIRVERQILMEFSLPCGSIYDYAAYVAHVSEMHMQNSMSADATRREEVHRLQDRLLSYEVHIQEQRAKKKQEKEVRE